MDQIGTDEELFRQLGDLIVTVLEDQNQLVELGTLDFELLAGNFVTDITGLAVVGDFEGFESDFLGIDFVVAAGFREARVERAILRQQCFKMADDILGKVLEIFARLGKVCLNLFHFLTVLVDIE